MDELEMYARLRLAVDRIDAATDGREWLAQRHIRRVMDAMADEFRDRTDGDLRWQATTVFVPQEAFADGGPQESPTPASPVSRYTVTIRFDTDRELTPDELHRLIAHAQVQIEEPVDDAGDDIDATVSNVQARITKR